jgi:phosphoribosylaminoimidazole carboxylase (NCAIR synthetase)
MRTVIFVAPFLMDATLRFIQAAAAVPNVRLVVLTQDDPSRLPEGTIGWRARDALSAHGIVEASRAVIARTGGAHVITGILENIQTPIAEARLALGLPGIGPDVAERFRDKGLMKSTLRAHGLPCARHARLHAPEDAWAFVREVGFPLVLKPPAGAGCKGTYMVDGPDSLRQALAETRPTASNEVLAEEFVTGEEHSFDTIVLNGRVVFYNIGRYLPAPLEVTRNEWIQWCVLLPRDISGPEFASIREVGPAAVSALGLRDGFTHMEWFRRKDGSAVISEVGARPPGAQFTSVMSWAHDRSLYRAWAEATIDGRLSGGFTRTHAAGIAYLRGVGNGRVARVDGLEEAQRKVGPLVVETKLPQRGSPKSSSYEGDGFVIVRHADTRVVEAALSTLVQTLRVRYA